MFLEELHDGVRAERVRHPPVVLAPALRRQGPCDLLLLNPLAEIRWPRSMTASP